LNSFDSTGQIQVTPEISVLAVAERTGSLTEGEATYNGVIEMLVSYKEILPDNSENELSGRNDLDNRIVRPLQIKQDYIATLDQSLFNGMNAEERLFAQAVYYLRKYFTDNSLFGFNQINQWEITE